MVKIDRAGAAFVRRTGWDTAIPLSVIRWGGKLTVTCWQRLRRVARRYETQFGTCPFSDTALNYLRSYGDRYLISLGFVPQSDRSGAGVILAAQPDTDDMSSAADRDFPCSVLLLDASTAGMENRTSYDLAATQAAGQRAYLAVVGGQVVAIAARNGVQGSYAEVGVETAPDFRRRGYAAAAVRALSRDLFADGKTPIARVDRENTASQALFRSVGFLPAGGYFDLIGER